MPSFAEQLAAFDKKTTVKAEKVLEKASLVILGKVVSRSPVDTGRFRGNWQVELNSIPSGVVEAVDKDGGSTISDGESALAPVQIGDDVYIVNNLPYAQKLEDGHSQQAPTGMVAITAAEFTGIVEDIVNGGDA